MARVIPFIHTRYSHAHTHAQPQAKIKYQKKERNKCERIDDEFNSVYQILPLANILGLGLSLHSRRFLVL